MGSTEDQATHGTLDVDADKMRYAMAELEAMRFSGNVADGQVVAEVDGHGKLLGLEIDPDLEPRDYSKVSAWVLTAVQEARKAAGDKARQAMEAVVGDTDAFIEQAMTAIPWLPKVGKAE